MLLGSGSGESLPSLGSIPSSYRIDTNGEALYRLCAAVVERKLVDEKLWHESGKIPVVFARNAIQKLIGRMCGEAFKNNLEYSCEVRDNVDTGYGNDGEIRLGQLIAMFDLTTAGFLVIGEAVKALDEQEPLLGAAFYVVLTRSLHKWMRVYDYSAAEWYNEQLHEMQEQDDPDNQGNYEFPPVEKAIPPSVKEVETWPLRAARRLLRKHCDGPQGAWIEKLLSIARLSRLRSDAIRFEEEYDSPPVPSLLIVFRENDAIHACWDEEAAHYYEYNNEPACVVRFRPDHTREFDAALRTMHIFLKLNMEMAGLVNLLNAWEEKKHASQRGHRAEPELRAA